MNGKTPINEEMFADLLKHGMDKVADNIEADKSDFSKMLMYIRNREYTSAVKLADKKGLTSETEFENVIVFGKVSKHRYKKIKGGMACLAAAVTNIVSLKDMATAVGDTYKSVFLPGRFGDADTFKQQCDDALKFKDCVAFIFTKDGTLEPKYSSENDTSLTGFYKTIMELTGGTYVLRDFPTISFLAKGGFVETLRFLVRNEMLEPGAGHIDAIGGIDNDLRNTLKKGTPHKFRLHEPEIVIDQKTKRPSKESELYQEFFSMGYDITSEEVQRVSIGNTFVVVNRLYGKFISYNNDGEKITNNLFRDNLGAVTSELYDLDEKMHSGVTNLGEEIGSIEKHLQEAVDNILSELSLPKIEIDFGKRKGIVKLLKQFKKSWGTENAGYSFRDDDERKRKDGGKDGEGGGKRPKPPSKTPISTSSPAR